MYLLHFLAKLELLYASKCCYIWYEDVLLIFSEPNKSAEQEPTKLSALSQKEQRKLLRKVQEAADAIMEEFRSLRMATQIYLEDSSSCTKKRLVACICDVRNIQLPSPNCKSPLDDMEDTEDIADIFIKLVKKRLISFHQYGIIKHIVNNLCSENEALVTKMKRYEESFSEYIQRWVCESSIYHEGKFKRFDKRDLEDEVELVIITDDSWNENTPFFRIRELESILEKAFRCSSIFLRLESIEHHCLKLQYFISAHIAANVFPLTEEEWNCLTEFGVVELECLEYNYTLNKGTLH